VASTVVMVMVRGAAPLQVRAVEAERWLDSDTCFCFGRDVGLLCAAQSGGCTTLPLGWLSCVPVRGGRSVIFYCCSVVGSFCCSILVCLGVHMIGVG
jgi:hypothetical protein